MSVSTEILEMSGMFIFKKFYICPGCLESKECLDCPKYIIRIVRSVRNVSSVRNVRNVRNVFCHEYLGFCNEDLVCRNSKLPGKSVL
jgi:hypothetical protein